MHPPKAGAKRDDKLINADPASGRCRKSGWVRQAHNSVIIYSPICYSKCESECRLGLLLLGFKMTKSGPFDHITIIDSSLKDNTWLILFLKSHWMAFVYRQRTVPRAQYYAPWRGFCALHISNVLWWCLQYPGTCQCHMVEYATDLPHS